MSIQTADLALLDSKVDLTVGSITQAWSSLLDEIVAGGINSGVLSAFPNTANSANGLLKLDGSGNLILPAGVKDNSSSLGTSGQALTSTGTGVAWQSVKVVVSKTAFVDASGNDSTGAIGSPAKPYATAQAAYNALYTAYGTSTACTLFIGVGTFAGVTLTADWPSNISVQGMGNAVSNLGGINGVGTAGTSSTGPTNGFNVTLTADDSVTIGGVSVGGGAAYNDDGSNNATNGGSGGNVTLTGCYVGNMDNSGPDGGVPQNDANGSGAGGSAGTITLTGCTLSGGISLNGGNSGGYDYFESTGTPPVSDANGGNSGTLTMKSCVMFGGGSISDTGGSSFTSPNGNAATYYIQDSSIYSVSSAGGRSAWGMEYPAPGGPVNLNRVLYSAITFGAGGGTFNDYGIDGNPGAGPSTSPPSSNAIRGF